MPYSKVVSKGLGLIACRVVRTDIEFPSAPSGWQDVVPEHSKDVLEWTSALKASLAMPSPIETHLWCRQLLGSQVASGYRGSRYDA